MASSAQRRIARERADAANGDAGALPKAKDVAAADALRWPFPSESPEVVDLAELDDGAWTEEAPAPDSPPAEKRGRDETRPHPPSASPDTPAERAQQMGLRDRLRTTALSWTAFREAGRRWKTPERIGLLALGLLAVAEGVVILRSGWVPGGPVGQSAALAVDAGATGAPSRQAPSPSATAEPIGVSTSGPGGSRTGSSQLTIRTDPGGALVLVDGQSRGAAPVILKDLSAGEHQVVVRTRNGEIRQRVRLNGGEPLSLVIPLGAARLAESGEAALSLKAPIELRVYDGDRLLGTSAMERIPLSAGSHRLVLKNEEIGFEQARTVSVTAGKKTGLTIDIPAQPVAINAAPWADVFLDGKPAGQTPIGGLAVEPGQHTLVFRHPQLGEKSVRLLVKAGESGRVSVDMRKQQP